MENSSKKPETVGELGSVSSVTIVRQIQAPNWSCDWFPLANIDSNFSILACTVFHSIRVDFQKKLNLEVISTFSYSNKYKNIRETLLMGYLKTCIFPYKWGSHTTEAQILQKKCKNNILGLVSLRA